MEPVKEPVGIRKIAKTTVVQQVMDQVKELIASGRFRVGDMIPSELELAEMFGVGRSTVREAVKLFNYLGILKSEPGRGTRVCERTSISTEALTWSILLGRNDMFEMVELRALMEERGLRSLMADADGDPARFKEVMGLLEREVRAMERALDAPSVEEMIQADYGFHGIVIGASGIGLFGSIYGTLRAFMHEEMRKSMRANMKDVVEEHGRYLEALRGGDRERILAVLAEHIEDVKTDLRRSLGR
jgi:GntR family transcriptional regulator, transcriptional repressor for pyruvate dehydrogenase complex